MPFSRAYQLKDIEKIADLPNGVLSENGGLTDDKSATFNVSISELFDLVKHYDDQAYLLIFNKKGQTCSLGKL